jgi:two-component system cell cycle sensor histidine kinase/response regulator CckA
MIINLVVNAVDAMPEGGLLTIATANEESGERPIQKDSSGHQGPKIVLSVSDTGIGMDEETISKIFKPFFTTKKKGAGTGLGLAIAFDAVKENDGFIRVDSRPGRGSTFKIYLPRVHEE